MTEADVPPLILYGALWGASFDSDLAGAVTSNVMVYTPFDEEWAAIEQRDVYDARRSSSSTGQTQPPPCILAIAPRDGSESIDEARHRAGRDLTRNLADAVSALRIAKSGWFLDPRQVALTFTINERSWSIRRVPGPYRQAMLGGIATPLPPYALSIADLGTGEGMGDVCSHAAAIAQYRSSGGNPAADIALAQFNRSFGLSLANGDRAAMLFTSIDAMFGGMSARKIGRMRLKRFGFRGRVEEALLAAGTPEEAKTEAGWLDWSEGGRGLRNALAHGDIGRLPPGMPDEAVLRLQNIVRKILPGFLAFSVRIAADQDGYAELDLTAQAGVTAAYNRALERKRSDAVAPLRFEW